jgi:membrane protease YdiL (CAAX protease family)
MFAVIAAFTMLIHTPLEELYWRGAAMDAASPRSAVWGSIFFFYWLHAGPLYFLMGTRGLWLALPTAFAGGVWALSTLRTKNIWPALISHWAAEVAILYGVLRYLRP